MTKRISLLVAIICWFVVFAHGAASSGLTPRSPAVSHYERPATKGGPYKRRVLVFVHGIFGDSDGTWRFSPSVYWPKLLLSDEAFRDSDIYVASYSSPYFGNTMNLEEVVTGLNSRLVSDGVFSQHREVVFVCHSLGGLIVQRLLLTFRDYAQQVPFIYFFSTPETGAQIANLAAVFSSDPLLKALIPGGGNVYLQNLENEWKAANFHIHRFCAYEKTKYMGVLVVDRLSSTRSCDDPPIPINENHVTIVKPDGPNHDSYVALRNAFNKYPVATDKSPRGHKASGMPEPFRPEEVGILIAEAPGDENHARQTAYQAAILHMIEATPELKDLVKVRLLEKLLSPDIEAQHADALKLGRSLHASFVLQPNGLAGFEEPWITIVDQPAFTSSHAFMGSFATLELAQPDKLRLPRDVIQLARCTLALLLYREHLYEAAVQNLDAVLASPDIPKAAPLQADLRIAYGNALLGIRRVSDAEVAYRDAIKLNPDSAEAHNNLGWALCLQEEFDESMHEARKAIELRPSYADAHVTLGVAMAHTGRLDEAIAEYRVAAKYGPNLPYVYSDLGNAFRKKGMLDKAIAEQRHAIELDPNYGPAYLSLGAVFGDRKQYKEAISNDKKAIELLRDSPQWTTISGNSPDGKPQGRVSFLAAAYFSLASDHLELVKGENGSYDEVIAEFREAVRLAPGFAEAHYGLGDALGLSGALDEAVAEFRQAVELKPNYAAAHHDLGVALEKKGEFDDAIGEHRRAVSICPDYENHYSLGVALCNRMRYEEALQEIQEAVRLKPDFPDGYLKLCEVYSIEVSREATAACQGAVKLNPDSPEAHSLLGLALAREARDGEAVVEYKKAIKLKPDVAEVHYNLGLALMGIPGEAEQARSEFRTAKRLSPGITVPPF